MIILAIILLDEIDVLNRHFHELSQCCVCASLEFQPLLFNLQKSFDYEIIYFRNIIEKETQYRYIHF